MMRCVTRALLVVLVSGCGRLYFDAGPDAGPCTWGEFFAPERVPGQINTDDDEWSPASSADDRTMYFYSPRLGGPGTADIWLSTRVGTTNSFSAATLLANVSSPLRDVHPHPTADELLLFLSSDRAGGPNDIYVASRSSTALDFSTPVAVTELNTPNDEDGLAITPDARTIVISSDRTSNVELYIATRADRSAPFGPLAPIAAANSSARENTPALSSDALELFFVSDRSGGAGGTDLYRASRASTSEPFANVENVAVLNSARDEYGPSLSADGTRIYFAYDTSIAGDATADIWVATRRCD
jgi:Tol biopolymer transport system component